MHTNETAMKPTATQSTKPNSLADPLAMQHRLFAALSAMFGTEVPLYDRSLLVNRVCNEAVCRLVARRYRGFTITPDELDQAGGERHGAIRIGRADEYKLVGRFFGCFAMEPHGFYDMTSVGAKSQPVIATAFRSRRTPQHRVFTSLLVTDYFDETTRSRIEGLMAQREVFSERARELIARNEAQGGLSWADAQALIDEATTRIFKWAGRAKGKSLYDSLSQAGFKIAADIACFESHHLNHLTPNTLAIDVYTAAMKFCFGTWEGGAFRYHAGRALRRLASRIDRDWMRLQMKHVTDERLASFDRGHVSEHDIQDAVEHLVTTFLTEPYQLIKFEHCGFKGTTEGPPADRPILLRQDAYRALAEPVVFVGDDGSETKAFHRARFGEIEERWYACTPSGRSLYDSAVGPAEEAAAADPDLAMRDLESYERLYAAPFAPVPTTLRALLDRGLAYARFSPTERGLAHAAGGRKFVTQDLLALTDLGFVKYDGIRHEDFLPTSAAGIFASNLSQYGTACTAAVKPTYSQAQLEAILGREIIDPDSVYLEEDASSRRATREALGLRM